MAAFLSPVASLPSARPCATSCKAQTSPAVPVTSVQKSDAGNALRTTFYGPAVGQKLGGRAFFVRKPEAFDRMPAGVYASTDVKHHKNVPVRPLKTPVRVAITGAAGQIGYLILGRIANGDMLGKNQPVILQCLEIPPALPALEGVRMEMEDSCYPLLKNMVVTSDPLEAFKDADYALLIGSRPRGPGMERSDLLQVNGPIFVGQGKALNEVASPNCKIIVVGNPANTNALIAASHAPNIPIENFSAMTRLDQNRAEALLARKAGVNVEEVQNVICWGNHSPTLFPDVYHATIGGKRALDVVKDDEWMLHTYLDEVQQRAAKVIELRGLSSATSAANAVINHVHDWALGTEDGAFVSMGLMSDGSYDVPPGVFFSVPVVPDGNGHFERVRGLELNEKEKAAIAVTRDELFHERELVKEFLGPRQ